MNEELLTNHIRRYFLISIKKLLMANKAKVIELEKEQNSIKNEVNQQKTLGFEYVENVERLNNKYKELETMKPIIDFQKIGDKCLIDYSKKYNVESEVIERLINKTIYIFRQMTFTISTFKRFKKEANKRYYEKHKKEDTMTLKENALNTATKKREKSLKVFNEVIEILTQKGMKISSSNIYETIKNDFNDCLSLRQVQRYFKEIKSKIN